MGCSASTNVNSPAAESQGPGDHQSAAPQRNAAGGCPDGSTTGLGAGRKRDTVTWGKDEHSASVGRPGLIHCLSMDIDRFSNVAKHRMLAPSKTLLKKSSTEGDLRPMLANGRRATKDSLSTYRSLSSAAAFRDAIQVTGGLGSEGCEDADPKVCAEVAKTLHCADPCRTPMYDAAKNGQLIMFKGILGAVSDQGISVPPLHLSSAICAAVVNNHTEVVKHFISQGSKFGTTPMPRISDTEVPAAVKIRTMVDSSRNSPLKLAAACGHYEMLKVLIEARADVNGKSSSGRTPLMEGAERGDLLIVRALLDAGALSRVVAEDGTGPMIMAVKSGNMEVVRAIIDAGGNTSECSKEGVTPLFQAIEKKSPEIVRLILEHGEGADVHNSDGASPLMVAALMGATEVMKVLIEFGANVDFGDLDGDSPLWGAAKEGHLEAAKLLLDAGANIDSERASGEAPLWMAAYYGHNAIVQLLCDAGADVDCIDRRDVTPLVHAAAAGKVELAQILVDAGADINAFDERGNPVILHAIARGCIEIVQMLTDYNVDLEFKEEDGKDLMEIARDLGYDEIMFHLAKVKGVEPLQTISKAESGQFRQTFSNKYSERPTDEEDLSRPNSNFDSATKERRQQEQSVRRKSREEARIRMRRASSEDGY